MLSLKPTKYSAEAFSSELKDSNSSRELKFITELGRSLLFTVHPKKVVSRVAEAIQSELGAEICAVACELAQIGLVSCAFAADSPKQNFLHKAKFQKWLEILPSQISFSKESEKEFLLKGKLHTLEYVSPLHINGEVKGALIVGFQSRKDCTETTKRLIDAATQMAAMSINLSAHYEAAINTSINEAREEQRKFTESILDALPVSLYVIDRDYRIVTWNRHREIGAQGIPRDSVIGRNVFQVLAKYPQAALEAGI